MKRITTFFLAGLFVLLSSFTLTVNEQVNDWGLDIDEVANLSAMTNDELIALVVPFAAMLDEINIRYGKEMRLVLPSCYETRNETIRLIIGGLNEFERQLAEVMEVSLYVYNRNKVVMAIGEAFDNNELSIDEAINLTDKIEVLSSMPQELNALAELLEEGVHISHAFDIIENYLDIAPLAGWTTAVGYQSVSVGLGMDLDLTSYLNVAFHGSLWLSYNRILQHQLLWWNITSGIWHGTSITHTFSANRETATFHVRGDHH